MELDSLNSSNLEQLALKGLKTSYKNYFKYTNNTQHRATKAHFRRILCQSAKKGIGLMQQLVVTEKAFRYN